MRNNYVFILVLIFCSKLGFGQALPHQFNFKSPEGPVKKVLLYNNNLKYEETTDFLNALMNYKVLTQYLLEGGICDLTILTQPVSQTICTGQQLSLSVVAGGTPPFFYQWKIGSTSIPDATNDTYIVNPASVSNAGIYKCWVGSNCGRVYSSTATIDVNTSISISSQPQEAVKCVGDSVVFNVIASGSGTLEYQWYHNNIIINGANQSLLKIKNISIQNAGAYKCVISNSCGNLTSDVVNLTVNTIPVFNQQPTSQVICIGNEGSFVTSVSGAANYQWYFYNDQIIGATNNTYTINQVSLQNEGDYWVFAANSCGNNASDLVNLTVDNPPSILDHSGNIERCEGSEAIFSVNATGTETLLYQWYFNGNSIENATTPSYAINTISVSDNGKYTCKVNNSCNFIISDTMQLVVDTQPGIIDQTSDGQVCIGADFTFGVSVSGTETLIYQWYHNDLAIDQTGNTFTINNVTTSDAGDYYCYVSNKCGDVYSNIVTLSVDSLPQIITQPVGAEKCSGDVYTLSLVASASASESFQWYLNGNIIDNSNSPELDFISLSVNDAGEYYCVVSNSCGQVTSAPVTLTIDTPPVITNQSGNQNLCDGDKLQLSVTANGTDITYQWWYAVNPIEGATDSSLEIKDLTNYTSGTFFCVVSGKCSPPAVSDGIFVGIDVPPSITQQPVNVEQCNGKSALFAVTVDGTNLNFQWYVNGVIIKGANESNFSITSLTYPDDEGDYSCVIFNSCGSVTSNSATLIIDTNLKLNSDLLPVEVCAGGNAAFSIDVSGPNPHYQWIKDHSVFLNTTSNTYTIDPVNVNDAGQYAVGVYNSCASVQGELMSNFVYLTVDNTPEISVQPVNVEQCEGMQAIFSVVASGSSLSYHWYYNGFVIPGAIQDSLTISSIVPEDAGEYSCIVSNACGSTTSDIATLTIDTPVSITTDPIAVEQCEGTDVTFTVVADGNHISYQWYYRPLPVGASGHHPVSGPVGTLIDGATGASYSINDITSADSHYYYCKVYNACGSQLSNFALLTVDVAPQITVQPANVKQCVGNQAVFTVTSDGTPLNYQWYFNNNLISDANGNTLTILSIVNPNDAGNYSCVVSNTCGSATSDIATLSIDTPIIITKQPVGAEQCEGTNITFTVETSGGPVSYQWYYGPGPVAPNHNPVGFIGIPIEGATDSSFTINDITFADANRYFCKVSNACGSQFSSFARLIVDIAPAITQQPVDVKQCEGSQVVFSVIVTGTHLSYQWFLNDNEITGAIQSSLTIPSIVNPADAGLYTCRVYNSCNSVVSDPANLTIDLRPAITSQPTNATTCQGVQTTLSVSATGTAIAYQWYNIAGLIAGASDATYLTSQSGNYHVVVSGTCLPSVTSNVATVTVDVKPAIVSAPVSAEQCEGTSISGNVVATGSQPLSYQWYKDGSLLQTYTNSSYTIPSINGFYQGVYTCVVSNACGSVTTAPATLTIDLLPRIVTQPVGGIGCKKHEFTFNVGASGNRPLSYQWYSYDLRINKAVDSSFTIINLNVGHTGNYSVVVSNNCGSVTSNIAVLTVTPDIQPVISSQPVPVETCEGNSASFSVAIVGSASYSYQWHMNGASIEGATKKTYSIASIGLNNQGNYSCVISNYCFSTSSASAALTVDTPPVFTVQPVAGVKCIGDQLILSVAVDGTTPFTYHWYKNAIGIHNATNNTYTINSLSSGDAGIYTCVATNTCNTVISAPATLTVVTPVSINQQPADVTKCFGSGADFSVSVVGANPSYQWYFNNQLIPDAIGTSYSINSISEGNTGEYYCVISGCNTITSNIAALNVGTAPQITLQPFSGITCPEVNYTFNIAASGFGIAYQWYNDNGLIDGASIGSYLTSVSGSYYCMVAGTCGDPVKSDVAVLSVDTVPSIQIEPLSAHTCPEVPHTFSVMALGTNLTYQWYDINGLIDGAINSTYQTASNGNYYCVVTGKCGSPAQSDVASLEVDAVPSVTLQPLGAEQCTGTDITLTSAASGTAALTYKWYLNGLLIEGAPDSPEYTFTLDNTGFAGKYKVLVSNSCGSALSDSAVVVVDTPPSVIAAPSVITKVLGDSIRFIAEPLGTPVFNYQWLKDNVNIEGATFNFFKIAPISYLDSGAYSCFISNGCGDITAPVAKLIVRDSAHYNLSGTLTYDNIQSSPITNTKLYLKNADNSTVDSTSTDESGAYNFGRQLAGAYYIDPVITKNWGGGNPLDALYIMRYYLGIYDFTDALRLKAADAYYDLKITPIDALYINQRYVLAITSFPHGDWVSQNDAIKLNSDINYNFKALCVGDVDGSYNMLGAKIMFSDILNSNTIKANPGQMFDMPVTVAKDMKLGALGLKFRFKNSNIRVYEVNSNINGLIHNIKGNEINVAWADAQSYNLTQGDQILTLKCMITADDYDVDGLFSLSSESILADNNANIMDIQNIRMPKLIHQDNASFSFSSYPNPFISTTSISYYLPASSDVKVVINDVLGQEVAVLVNESQNSGIHNVTFDAANFVKGIYFYSITAGNETGTGKLLKVK